MSSLAMMNVYVETEALEPMHISKIEDLLGFKIIAEDDGSALYIDLWGDTNTDFAKTCDEIASYLQSIDKSYEIRGTYYEHCDTNDYYIFSPMDLTPDTQLDSTT